MTKLITLMAILGALFIGYEVTTGGMNVYQAVASLMVPAAFIATVVAAWLAARVMRGLWRAARGVNAETVARTAGALTSAAQDHAARLTQAFKDGRNDR